MRMLSSIKIMAMSICVLVITSGCSAQSGWFRDRSKDYKDAESYSTIKVPAGLNTDSFSNEYIIPGK